MRLMEEEGGLARRKSVSSSVMRTLSALPLRDRKRDVMSPGPCRLLQQQQPEDGSLYQGARQNPREQLLARVRRLFFTWPYINL